MNWANAQLRYANFVRILAQARAEDKVTFTGISTVTSANRHSVSNWERGAQVPSTVGFIAWADSLGYEVWMVKK